MRAKVISEYIRCVVCNFAIQRLYLLEISIVINKRKKKNKFAREKISLVQGISSVGLPLSFNLGSVNDLYWYICYICSTEMMRYPKTYMAMVVLRNSVCHKGSL